MKKKVIIIALVLVGGIVGIMAQNKEQPVNNTPLSKVESGELFEIQASEEPQEIKAPKEAPVTQPPVTQPPAEVEKVVEKELADTDVLAYIQSLETDNIAVLLSTYYTHKEVFNKTNYKHLLSGMDEYFNNNSAIVTSSPRERKLELERLRNL